MWNAWKGLKVIRSRWLPQYAWNCNKKLLPLYDKRKIVVLLLLSYTTLYSWFVLFTNDDLKKTLSNWPQSEVSYIYIYVFLQCFCYWKYLKISYVNSCMLYLTTWIWLRYDNFWTDSQTSPKFGANNTKYCKVV